MITKIKTGIAYKRLLTHTFPWQSWPGNEPLVGNGHANHERSYNCAYFNSRTSDRQSLFFGILPEKEVNASQMIEFWPEKNGELTVTLRGGKPVVLKNFSLAESLKIYKKSLPKTKSIALLDSWRLGFSWPSAGPFGVDQTFILNELAAAAKMPVDGKPFVQTYIIDHGWSDVLGDNNFDRRKFPRPAAITSRARCLKIVPGLWVAPFLASPGSELVKNHPDWFIKNNGRLVKDPLWLAPRLKGLPILEKAAVLDISVGAVQGHIINTLKRLYDQGFGLFKLDFLYAALMGELKNKDKSPVTYYRELLFEIREALGKEVLFLGCGAPLMESVGLFSGMRFTGDSAMGRLPWLTDNPIAKLINGRMYGKALEQAERNAPLWSGLHGLVLDGIHLLDPKIPLPAKTRFEVGIALPRVWALGGRNITVGDRLASIEKSKEAREIWGELWQTLYRPTPGQLLSWPTKLSQALGLANQRPKLHLDIF